jgi:glucose-1-phosphatase
MISGIKNIIFDFGGVIIPVDPMAYAGGMVDLGCRDIKSLHEQFMRDQVYMRFETGQISPEEFRKLLRTSIDNHATDEHLDQAWNLILGEISPLRVKFLESLRNDFRTFLLSNTNKIHYDYYNEKFCRSFGYHSLDDLFEKAYYSFKIGLYKPYPEIYDFVLKDSGLNPEETVFIDDNLSNIQAAAKCGIRALQLTDIESLEDVVFSATKARRH